MSEGIKVPVGVENAAFKTGLNECRAYAKEFAGEIKHMFIGAFAVGAVIEGFHEFMESMAKVADRAKRFGESTETIQRIGHAAKLAGADMDLVARALTKITIASAEAAGKGGEMGDKWEKAGLEAGKFASLSMQDKLIELSEAWEKANGNTEAQVAIMSILGNKAQDLIPMLAEGPEEMRKNMASASVATSETVATMKALDDGIVSIKNKSVVVFSWIVNAFQTLGEVWIPRVVFALLDLFEIGSQNFKDLGILAKGLGEAMYEALHGNFKKASQSWKNALQEMDMADRAVKAEQEGRIKALGERYDEIWTKKDAPELNKGKGIDASETMENAKRVEALKAEIAKKQQENALALMAYDEKRAALQKEIADAQAKSNDKTVEGLEAKKTALELQGKLADLEKKHAEEQQRVKDDIAKLESKNAMALMDYEQKRLELQKQIAEEQKKSNDTTTEGLQAKKNAIELQGKLSELEKKHSDDLANAKEQEAKVDEKNALDRMTPEQQRAYRINQQKKLMEESEAAAKRGDDVEAITKRTKAKEIEKDLLPDKEKAKDIKGAVTVSTLRGVGGGGFVGGTQSSDPTLRAAEKGNSYLERITRAVEAQAKGSAVNPAEIMRNNSYPYSKQ